MSFRHLTVDVRTLKGFDAKANRWSEYDGGSTRGQLANRRGEKSLQAWISAKAIEVCQCPNPEFFSFYRTSPGSR